MFYHDLLKKELFSYINSEYSKNNIKEVPNKSSFNIEIPTNKKFGDVSTSKIIGVGEEVISEFEARGGKMTVLAGAEKDKFDKLMSEKVLPAMMDKFDADALKAAEAFVAN